MKIKNKSKTRHTGDINESPDNNPQRDFKVERDNNILSTRTSFHGGTVRSAEFLPIINIPVYPKGLTDFKKAIGIIQDRNWDWRIEATFREFDTKSIIECERRCAIVHISGGNIGSRFIFEFNRSEFESVSTLLVKPFYYFPNPQEVINHHLSLIVKNTFHWDVYRLRQNREFEYLLLRHVTDQTIEAWAERIMKKLFFQKSD
ncbi:MAG: hypothetical protein HPY53_14900 [Brevinematales bacterium]|nr:hypothetical protein [Brevinematales bacterium]